MLLLSIIHVSVRIEWNIRTATFDAKEVIDNYSYLREIIERVNNLALWKRYRTQINNQRKR